MQVVRLAPALLLVSLAGHAWGQVPAPPPAAAAPAQEPEPPSPPPTPPPDPSPAPPPPSAETVADAPPEAAPAPAASPVSTPPAVTGPVATAKAEPDLVDAKPSEADRPAPWQRVRSPLTLDARLGVSWRPEGDGGFDDETTLGSEVGASLYFAIKPEIAAGIEIDRVGLGRGTALNGFDSVSVDYAVTSALLGFRAYPMRADFFDVFVGFQVGLGLQSVSATGTASNGPLTPASSYSCDGTDSPALQIGGGVGARLMLSERWGITARVNGTGRRLSGELVNDCAKGVGTTTSVAGSLGVGYDFEMDN